MILGLCSICSVFLRIMVCGTCDFCVIWGVYQWRSEVGFRELLGILLVL